MKLEFIPISETDDFVKKSIQDDCIAILLHTVNKTTFWIEILSDGKYMANGFITKDFESAKGYLFNQATDCFPDIDLSDYPEFLPSEITKYIASNESDCFNKFKSGLNELGYTCNTLIGNRAKGLRKLTTMEQTVFKMFGQLSGISTDFNISIHHKKGASTCLPISKEILTALMKLIE
jgi:hypothetical protein